MQITEPKSGTVINRYKITLSVGKGGTGKSFLAQNTKLKRKAANLSQGRVVIENGEHTGKQGDG